ncbi:MAG: glutamate--tRNA ligase [Verrucomicrobiota bacterium]|nr:glutamate--tRNA ligase [Verrucomicrobiota bacterium]
MSDPVRVRFAPSPTGYLHIGGARTALFNWLHAKHTGGTFVLRVEDTDKSRNTDEAAHAIYEGLRWLGLTWDEGPYFQSQREAIYEGYLEKLQAAGRVYEDNGSTRFKFAREKVVVDDVICGHIAFDMTSAETNPDMTVRRPDGSWIFHFVNVVDDIEMKITHVIRGEDHLSNTPKHIQLYHALGATPPTFAHIPLILNKDGSKMSKRDQGASMKAYVDGGYAPEAVRNFLCLLGWSPKDNREKLPIEEVIPLFDLSKINRKNATFDLDKLLWLNAEYLRDMSIERFRELSREALERAGVELETFDPNYVNVALDTCKGKVRLFSELPTYAGFYFTDTVAYNHEAAAIQFTDENKTRLAALNDALVNLAAFDAASIETALKTTAKDLGVKPAALVHPTRLALTGATAGPSLYHLMEVLGKEQVLQRLANAPFATS